MSPGSALAALLVARSALGAEPPLAPPGWAVDVWTQRDGLPVDHLNEVAVDANGALWIATFDGLVRFDGVSFETMRSDHPLGPTSTRVLRVTAHPDGALWVMDEARRLQRRTSAEISEIDPDTFRAVQAPSPSEDALWLITGQGLTRLDEVPSVVPTPTPARFVITAPGGGLWVIDDALAVWHRAPGEAGWRDLGARAPTAIAVRDPETGGLAFHDAADHLKVWSEDEGAFTARPGAGHQGGETPPVPSRWSKRSGQLLLDGELLLAIDPVLLHVDGEQVWVSTQREGLVRVRPSPLSAQRAPDGARSNVQRLWWDAPGRALWAQAEEQGWWPVYREGEPPAPLPPLPAPLELDCLGWTWSLFSDPEGGRWLSCHGHLLHEEGGAWVREPDIARVREGPGWSVDGAAWLGGPGPALIRRDSAWREIPTRDGPLEHLTAIEAVDGAVFLGAAEGLWRAPAGGGEPIRLDGGWSPGAIRHLRADGPWLWISTVERGLCAADIGSLAAAPAGALDDAPRCLGGDSPLGRVTVHATLADDRGRIWISSNQGIGVARADLLADWAGGGEAPGIIWLGEPDGMLNAEGNGFTGMSVAATPDGRLWFATQDGVVAVDPARFTDPAPPRVYWRDASAGDTSWREPEAIALPTEHAPLRLRWSAPAVPWAEQMTFRYRLSPESPWSPAPDGRALELPALPPGDSTIEVQGRLGGAWGPSATLTVTRAPALYERSAFPLLVALLIAAAGLALLAARSRAQAHRNRELASQVATQTRQLADQNADLQSLNETLRGQNAQIAEQARQLTELDALKRQLIANISHELRTPLALIMAPLGSLLAGATPGSRDQRHLRMAADSVRRLDELIGQLFDLSRAQAGGIRLKIRRLDLRRLVEDIAQRFEPLATERGVALALALPEAPQPAWLERDLLDKVLSNLLSNALRYSPAGGTVYVGLEPDRASARLTVEDEGPGVPAEHREAIFERFFQVEGAGPKGGTGLGLALVRELIELHGGQAGVEAGRVGARFWLSLPLGVAHFAPDEISLEPQDEQAAPGADPAPAAGGEPVPGGRVLLAEDHPQLRAYLAEVLSERFEVVAVADGAEALERAREERFDLLITDIMMPRMTGKELVAALRERPPGAELPVLFISARGELEDRLEGLGQGDDYLPKPFQAPELVARAAALLRRSQRPASAHAPPAALSEAARFEARLIELAAPRLSDPGFNASALAKAAAMSPRTLQLRMQTHALPSPGEWLRQRRLRHAEVLLRSGAYATVAEVAAEVGMSRSYFSRLYRAQLGRSPGADLRSGDR